jgi:DNA-binding MarR family transcriptional regulator
VIANKTIQGLEPAALFEQLQIVPQICPGTNIGKAHKSVVRIFEEEFREISITPVQFSVLVHIRILDEPGCSELAEQLGSDPSTISRIVDTLDRKQLIHSRAGTDRRTRRYTLTDTGVDSIKRGLECWTRANDRIMQKIGLKRWGEALELLRLLSD